MEGSHNNNSINGKDLIESNNSNHSINFNTICKEHNHQNEYIYDSNELDAWIEQIMD